MNPIEVFPDFFYCIIEYLSLEDICKLRRTCKNYHNKQIRLNYIPIETILLWEGLKYYDIARNQSLKEDCIRFISDTYKDISKSKMDDLLEHFPLIMNHKYIFEIPLREVEIYTCENNCEVSVKYVFIFE